MTAIHRIITYLLKLLARLFGKKKSNAPTNGVRLVTSDGYVITDINGLLLAIKEEK